MYISARHFVCGDFDEEKEVFLCEMRVYILALYNIRNND